MRHLKLFENFEDINSICKEYNIENYTVNSDGTIDVNGDVRIFKKGGSKVIPLRFGKVTGYFMCDNNKLTSLEGCPKEVGGDFHCSDNKLRRIEGYIYT